MRFLGFFILFTFLSCFSAEESMVLDDLVINKEQQMADYRLAKANNQKALLILFTCYPCDAENTQNEFKILEVALKNNISVLFMNFNQRLFLQKKEKEILANQLNEIINDEKLKNENVFIGGFSSGGNVSFLISDYLIQTQNKLQPKGVFLVDSPVDLLGLYKVAKKNIDKNVDADAVQESKWIKEELETVFGKPESGIQLYEENSPFTSASNNIQNLMSLQNIKVRMYTEPDFLWWKEKKDNDKEDLNAFYIEKLAEVMKSKNFKKVDLIKTTHRGLRSNGMRHPHSWSIVDENDLVKWILKE